MLNEQLDRQKGEIKKFSQTIQEFEVFKKKHR